MNCSFSCLKNNNVKVNSPSCDDILNVTEEINQNLDDLSRLGVEDASASVSSSSVIPQYFSVINFPSNKKFRLKKNNKVLSKRWQDFTSEDQHVIFKRKIKEWRMIAEGTIRIIPEWTKECNMHYNLVYSSKLTIKDIDIILTDAYGTDHASRKYFVCTKLVTDLDGLNKYLKKQDVKQYQYTGIEWEIQNV